jgi:biopolymer transport protein ExbB
MRVDGGSDATFAEAGGAPPVSAVVALLAKGGPVMIPLAVCSVVALAVVLERAWTWRGLGRRHDAEAVLARAAAGKWEDACKVGEASRSPVARVLAAGIRHRNPAATLAMEATARTEMARLKRFLPVLDTIITLSPLLGLLGTVTGMISAFGVMAQSGMNAPDAITGGVGEALIATAAGLGVAIAALVPFNFFHSRVETLLDTIERYGSRLELLLAETVAHGERAPTA